MANRVPDKSLKDLIDHGYLSWAIHNVNFEFWKYVCTDCTHFLHNKLKQMLIRQGLLTMEASPWKSMEVHG